MKFLEKISIDDYEKWDSIVRSFSNYDVYYLSGYVKGFQIHGDGEPILLYFNNGTIRSINVVMLRDIAEFELFDNKIEKNKYFDIVTPYGYGGMIYENDGNEAEVDNMLEAYVKFCNDNNIVSEFVRFHPLLNNSQQANKLYEVVSLGNTVCIDTTSKDIIWNNIISKNRNMIRKAEKNNIKVCWGTDFKLIDTFIEIYNATMEKDNANDYYYFDKNFYESVLKDLKHNAMFFYAILNNEIIAISIILFSNNSMHYHLSASKKEYMNLAPTNLLLYEAACWGSEQGYKKFHLGGGLGSKEDNLYKFKKSFNRNGDFRFSIGKKIFNQDIYNKLVDIRSQVASFDSSTNFFPKYRG